MFLGHFAFAFAAKRAAPRASLGALFVAAQFADLLWPTLLLTGVERVRIDPQAPFMPQIFEHYPYSHSLLTTLLWAALLAAGYLLATGYRRGAAVIAALVVSHWLLDAIVHLPDLPLAPGSETTVGLYLWSQPAATLALELGVFAGGLLLYLRTAGTAGRSAGLWALVALLLVIYGLDRFSGVPPPSVAAVAWVGQAQWLLAAWAFWVDRQRLPASLRTPAPS